MRGVWVRGDRTRIQQVMRNLPTNAMRYPEKRKEVNIPVRRDGEHGDISVTGYGTGMPKEQPPHLIELHFRGTNVSAHNFGGLGLSLYISKAIVERRGGSIGVVSAEGKGGTVYFWLPSL